MIGSHQGPVAKGFIQNAKIRFFYVTWPEQSYRPRKTKEKIKNPTGNEKDNKR